MTDIDKLQNVFENLIGSYGWLFLAGVAVKPRLSPFCPLTTRPSYVSLGLETTLNSSTVFGII